MQIVLARTTFQQQAKDIPNKNKRGCSFIHGQQKTGSTVVPHNKDFFANFEKGQKLVNISFSGKRKENFPSKCIGFSEKKNNEVNI